MNYLKIYINGQYYGRKFSIEHLTNSLERKYIRVERIAHEHPEIARIRADKDIYTVFQ